MTYSNGFGSTLARLISARRACICSNVAGSPVSREGVRVRARLDVTGHQVLRPARPASPPIVAIASSSAMARGSPMPVTPARRSRPGPRTEQVDRDHGGRGSERADERTRENVVVFGVAELVRDDAGDLGRGGLFEQRVVDDDAAGRAEAGHVGVDRAGAAGGVGDQHILDRYAVAVGHRDQLGPQRAVGHRGEMVEDRLEQRPGTTKDISTTSAGRSGRSPRPPVARRQPDQAVEAEQHQAADDRRDRVALQHVDRPRRPNPASTARNGAASSAATPRTAASRASR